MGTDLVSNVTFYLRKLNDSIVRNTILMKICVARRSRGKGKGPEKEGTVSGRVSAWRLRLLERLSKVLASRHKF